MMNEMLELSRSVVRWQLFVLRTVNPLMFYLMSSMSYSPEDRINLVDQPADAEKAP
jgi:hypothetical protein